MMKHDLNTVLIGKVENLFVDLSAIFDSGCKCNRGRKTHVTIRA